MKTQRKTGEKGIPVCIMCKKPLKGSMAVTFTPPPGQAPLPAGSGWSICGSDCKALPEGAQVFYRTGGR